MMFSLSTKGFITIIIYCFLSIKYWNLLWYLFCYSFFFDPNLYFRSFWNCPRPLVTSALAELGIQGEAGSAADGDETSLVLHHIPNPPGRLLTTQARPSQLRRSWTVSCVRPRGARSPRPLRVSQRRRVSFSLWANCWRTGPETSRL